MTHSNSPGFPNTLVDAILYFSDEDTCRAFLTDLRWPTGVHCLKCDSDRLGYVQTRHLWRCKDCKYEFGVRKGTIFEDSPIPLSKWLAAMWLYSASKKGRSSHQLAKDLGVTQKSAWHMSHRIRLAMETESFERPLSGEVEADETFVGGLAKNQHASKRKHIGTGGPGKAAVMGLLERHGEVRAHTVPNVRRGPSTKRSATTSLRAPRSTPTRTSPTAASTPSTSTRSSTTPRATSAVVSTLTGWRTFGACSSA